MMKRLLTTAIFLHTLVLTTSGAVIPDMKFSRLDTGNGLSNSQVNCIFKDSRGFTWIGTSYGLNRFDGYRIKTFYSNKTDTTSMRDNYTDQIFEAYDGKLWLKQGMNYCIMDPETEHFERNVSKVLSQFGINGAIDLIYIDSKKNFWVRVFEDGIYYYNPYSKKLTHIRNGYGKNEINPKFGISTLADLGSSVIAASYDGELICMNGEQGRISWVNTWMKRNGGKQSSRYRLRIDPWGNLWVASEPEVFVYIQKERKWYRSLVSYLRKHGIDNTPDVLQVWDLFVDKRGWIWVATDHEGLIVADVKGRQAKQFLNNKFDQTTISDNTLRELYLDKQGTVWIGFYRNGICQYKENLSHFRSIELGEVNTVCEDRYGNYWVGTNDQGIKVYNPRTDELLQHYTTANSGLSANIMVGSWPGSDGDIWFGSYNGGLVRCVPKEPADQGAATILNTRATGDTLGLANNSVWSLIEDKWGRIWIGTLGSGVQMLDKKTGRYRNWNTHNSALPGDYMTTVCWTRKGWLMVGHGLYYSLINPVTGQLVNRTIPEDPLLTSHATTTNYVMEDSRGLVWQGANSGVYIYNPKNRRVQLLDMTKGLLGSSVCSIAEDKNHDMWVVTDHGVSRIVLQKQNDDGTYQFIVRSFDVHDGLQPGTYNMRSIWVARDGKLLVGGQGGLDIIDPARISSSNDTEVPIFSGLQLSNRDVAVGEEVNGRVILKKALNIDRHLRLRHSDNNFTVQLGSNASSVGYGHRFAYMLEGMDDNWVNTTENNPNITYMSLPHGRSYILRVRMLNEDGTLGNRENQLEIDVSAPLWRTRWAILLYMLIIAGGAWWWIRRTLRLQKEKMALEQLRRDMEKKQWMTLMRRQMEEEAGRPIASPPSPDQPVQEQQQERPEADRTQKVVLARGELIGFLRDVCNQFVAPNGKQIKVNFMALADKVDTEFDETKLKEAVVILLNNSAMFSPNDSRIKIYVDSMEDKAVVRISDKGVGIPDEVKDHVFDTFTGEGEDLRLDVVKAIVTAHGGNVRAEDNPGGGTLFVIELPVVKEIEVEEAEIMDDGEEDMVDG